jgi:hypothetical protein
VEPLIGFHANGKLLALPANIRLKTLAYYNKAAITTVKSFVIHAYNKKGQWYRDTSPFSIPWSYISYPFLESLVSRDGVEQPVEASNVLTEGSNVTGNLKPLKK